MKKIAIAVPVAIALLTFGISAKSMANPANSTDGGGVDDQIAAVAKGSLAVKDTLNNNDVDVKDVANDKSKEGDAEVENGDYDAAANFGGEATVDKSIKIKDIRIAVIKSDVKGQVKDNHLSFGKDLEQKSYGNSAEAENHSHQSSKNYQEAQAEQSNKSYQKLEQEQELKSYQKVDQDQKQKSEQKIKQFQSNKEAAVSKAKADQEAEAKLKAKQGGQKNAALAGEKSKQDQDAKNKSDQDAKAKAANKSDQDNKAKVANKADLANTNTQTALADAGSYSSTQSQSVYLSTGNNTMNNFSANGVNAIAQNTGVQSFIQQTQNVQANIY